MSLYNSETLLSKGTRRKTEKACPEPEDLEEDTLDTVVDGMTLKEIIPTLTFTFQYTETPNQRTGRIWIKFFSFTNFSKTFFQWSMDNMKFNLASHWAEIEASFQKICLKVIDFKYLMVRTKDWNLTRHFRLLEVRANRIRANQATIQAIEEQLTQTGIIKIPSGSQEVGQTSSPVASHHSETSRSVAKSHHSSQSQEVSRKDKDTRAKTRPLSTKGRKSQTQ
ncbi:hypothetical protein O181_020101 [Austropuccinia psidii MF-1]|uniref:Uncharacterized protein n=1 Tax=Austropuccinia psidii MF-1 TaxID=1389203 RepID=A0A9Q3GUI1_9BASI|nr:hypothetical protein [Austropuccinia psidii MF-1]